MAALLHRALLERLKRAGILKQLSAVSQGENGLAPSHHCSPAGMLLPGHCQAVKAPQHLRFCFSFAAFCILAYLFDVPGSVKHIHLNHHLAEMWWSLPALLGSSHQPGSAMDPFSIPEHPCSHHCLGQGVSGAKKPQPSPT